MQSTSLSRTDCYLVAVVLFTNSGGIQMKSIDDEIVFPSIHRSVPSCCSHSPRPIDPTEICRSLTTGHPSPHPRLASPLSFLPLATQPRPAGSHTLETAAQRLRRASHTSTTPPWLFYPSLSSRDLTCTPTPTLASLFPHVKLSDLPIHTRRPSLRAYPMHETRRPKPTTQPPGAFPRYDWLKPSG